MNSTIDLSSRRLLATDMDGTFLGNDVAMAALWEKLEANGIWLAFATGRHLDSIEALYATKKIPHRARCCVCMVGTDIYLPTEIGYKLDTHWHDLIAADWDHDAVETAVHSIDNLVAQNADWQSLFKCSYYVEQKPQPVLSNVTKQLDRAGLQAKIIYSGGRFLDLIPTGAGKGKAVAYLVDQLGLDRANVVTAGDSGNDEDMMTPGLGFRSIVVGNAEAQLTSLRGEHIYHASAHYAAGIIEGLQHLGWL